MDYLSSSSSDEEFAQHESNINTHYPGLFEEDLRDNQPGSSEINVSRPVS